MSERNPYAPPKVDVDPGRFGTALVEGGQRRDGNILVHRHGAEFADRCVKCNAPASNYRLKRVLYWHNPFIYLVILVNLLIYAIVALVVRKKAVVHVGLCQRHRHRRRNWILIGWGGTILGLAGFFALLDAAPHISVLGIIVFFVALFGGIIGTRVVWAQKIDDLEIRIKGVSEAYLRELPLDRAFN